MPVGEAPSVRFMLQLRYQHIVILHEDSQFLGLPSAHAGLPFYETICSLLIPSQELLTQSRACSVRLCKLRSAPCFKYLKAARHIGPLPGSGSIHI